MLDVLSHDSYNSSLSSYNCLYLVYFNFSGSGTRMAYLGARDVGDGFSFVLFVA